MGDDKKISTNDCSFTSVKPAKMCFGKNTFRNCNGRNDSLVKVSRVDSVARWK